MALFASTLHNNVQMEQVVRLMQRSGEVSKSREIAVVCVIEDLAFIAEVSKICKLELPL